MREDAAFADQKLALRHHLCKPFRYRQIDFKSAQIAIVNAQQRRMKPQRAVEFRLVMHFDKHVHAERIAVSLEHVPHRL